MTNSRSLTAIEILTASFSSNATTNPVTFVGPKARLVEKSRPDRGENEPSNCPMCNSTNIKFGYFNNNDLKQSRYICKACRRHWTHRFELKKSVGEIDLVENKKKKEKKRVKKGEEAGKAEDNTISALGRNTSKIDGLSLEIRSPEEVGVLHVGPLLNQPIHEGISSEEEEGSRS